MPRKLSSSVGELDKLIHWMDHIKNASKKCMVVTQHKKDRDVLKSIGCKNVIYPTKPESVFVQKIIDFEKPCILLFDGDRKSNSKCQKLRSLLEQNGIKVNTRFRKIMFTQASKTVAGLVKHIHRLAGSERVHRGLPV